MRAADNGWPDIIFSNIICGLTLVEVKAEDGVLSKVQQIRIHRINRAGGKAFVVYSWDDWVNLKKSLGLPG